jgi:hypothetical protein
MPRPTTKDELISLANSQWEKMWTIIDSVPGGAQSVVLDFADDAKLSEAHWQRDRNMRDVLMHLYEWHQLLLNWAGANLAGSGVSFLPEPYTWKSYGDMNVIFWEKHQSTEYDDAATLLVDSHARVMELIGSLTDEELFEKKHFAWTGTTNLGSYCISSTSSHYDWAMKKIRQYNKTGK